MNKALLLAILSALVGFAQAGALPVGAASVLGEYELVGFESPRDKIDVQGNATITLTLARGGKLSGIAGCNQYRGVLKASPFSVSAVAATRKMCADPTVMKLEQTYLAALAQVTALERVSSTELVLRAENQQALHFKLKLKPVEKVIWLGPEKKDCVAGVMKTQCLQYKTTEQGAWLNFYGPIEGFEWVAGKTYQLKVREEKIANPPADASNIKTSLVKVLSSQ